MEHPFDKWLTAQPPATVQRWGRQFADAAHRAGAFVIRPDGSNVPIPVLLTPAVMSSEKLNQASSDAHQLTRALSRLTHHLMTADPAVRDQLFGTLLPFERQALDATWRDAEALATVRVDFLIDIENRHRALEVNATIPAMQGYSDIVAEAFLRTLAAERGHADRADQLVRDNGSNSRELWHSLSAQLEAQDHAAPQLVAIVARPGDAQRGELEHYARVWDARTLVVVPDEVRLVDGKATVRGEVPDLIYRHVFLRRLDPQSDFAKICLAPRRYRVLNPPASHLEVKAMLGLLSPAADDDTSADMLGLSDEERVTIRRALPWTRLLTREPSRAPDGTSVDSLGEWVKLNPHTTVLKRSWDYGGRSVFVGPDIDSPSSQARLCEIVGHECGWSELVEFAIKDAATWVVQALISVEKRNYLYVGDGGVAERSLYTDFSAFTNLGVPISPTGGVVRAAEHRIVNILGGGGLQPLVRQDVLDSLFS